MSHARPVPPVADRCGPRHCLRVEAEPQTNLLLRLLEPFVIHDVLPEHVGATRTADALRVEIVFPASPDVAERLRGRLSVMIGIAAVDLAPAPAAASHPPAAARAA